MAETQSHDDYVVSELRCPAFMRWAICHRERNGGCPDIHDWETRKEIAAMNKARREEAQKQKRLADEKVRELAHREKLQRQYNDKLKATKATQIDDTDNSKPIVPDTTSQNNLKSTIVKTQTALHTSNLGTAKDVKTDLVESNAPVKFTNAPKKKKNKPAKRSKPVKDNNIDQTTSTASVKSHKIAITDEANSFNTKFNQSELAKSINNDKLVNGKPATTGKSIFSNKNERFAASRIYFQKFYNENKNGEVPADGIALPRAVFHVPTPPSSDPGDVLATKDSELSKSDGFSGLVYPISPPASEVDSADVTVIQNGILLLSHQDSSIVNKPHCKHFLRPKGCYKRDNCPYLHDYNHRYQKNLERKKELCRRKAEHVSTPIIPVEHVNLDTYDDSPTTFPTYAGVTSKDIVVRLHPIGPVAPEKNAWEEKKGDLELWARANIRDKAQFMLLKPFFSSDVLPSSFSTGYGMANIAIDGPVFELFPLLPGELRNKIWFHATVEEVLQPRNVRVGWVQLQKGNLIGDGIVSKTFTPSILNVNRESRSLALPYFKRTFSCKGYYTFFNYDIDQLFIHTTGPEQLRIIVSLIKPRNLERIKDLTLSVKDFARDNTRYR